MPLLLTFKQYVCIVYVQCVNSESNGYIPLPILLRMDPSLLLFFKMVRLHPLPEEFFFLLVIRISPPPCSSYFLYYCYFYYYYYYYYYLYRTPQSVFSYFVALSAPESPTPRPVSSFSFVALSAPELPTLRPTSSLSSRAHKSLLLHVQSLH